MRILNLSLAGFGSYIAETSLDLSEVDVAAVTGPNGAGKSTLFDAVLWALYGSVPGRSQDLVINESAGRAAVELTFDIGGGVHTVRRERKAGKTAAVAATYTGPDGASASGAKPVTQTVVDLLGCDADLLATTAMARQGDADKFGAMDASKRRTLLTGVMLAGRFDAPLNQATSAAEECRREAATSKERLNIAQSKADTLDAAEDRFDAAVEEADEAHQALEEAQEADRRASSARARLAEAEAGQARADRLNAEADRLEKSAAAKDAEAARAEDELPRVLEQADNAEDALAEAEDARDGARAAHEQASRAAAAAEASGAGAAERLEMLQRGDSLCWVCSAPLEDDLDDLIDEQRQLLDDMDAARRGAAAARQALGKADRAAKEASRARDAAAAKASDLNRTRADAAAAADKDDSRAADLREQAEDLERGLGDLETLRAEAADAPDPRVLADAKSRSDRALREEGQASLLVEQAKEALDSLEHLSEQHERARGMERGGELMQRALKPAGIPHMALQTYMEHLAANVNDALSRIRGLQIRFVMEDPTTARPPLEIEVRDGWGDWRPYNTFSGGERMSIDMAMRVGLMQLTGVRCRTVIIDEGWGALDAEAAALMAKLLVDMRHTSMIDACFTITHIEAAAAQFEHRIKVERLITGSKAELVRS